MKVEDLQKMKKAYKELLNAKFDSISVQQMAPLVISVGLLGDVITSIESENATTN